MMRGVHFGPDISPADLYERFRAGLGEINMPAMPSLMRGMADRLASSGHLRYSEWRAFYAYLEDEDDRALLTAEMPQRVSWRELFAPAIKDLGETGLQIAPPAGSVR